MRTMYSFVKSAFPPSPTILNSHAQSRTITNVNIFPFSSLLIYVQHPTPQYYFLILSHLFVPRYFQHFNNETVF